MRTFDSFHGLTDLQKKKRAKVDRILASPAKDDSWQAPPTGVVVCKVGTQRFSQKQTKVASEPVRLKKLFKERYWIPRSIDKEERSRKLLGHNSEEKAMIIYVEKLSAMW